MFLKWNSSLDTGTTILDDDHRRIVEKTNNYINAILAQRERGVVEDTLHDLLTVFYEHFGREEEFMLSIGYPHFEEHRQAHQVLLKEIDQIASDRGESQDLLNKVEASSIISVFLRLVTSHRDDSDQKLADYVEEMRAAAAG